MTFQYLVSVLNCKDIEKLIANENINADAIIVNQCDKNNIYEIKKENYIIKVIETTERGLSKSRNLAIKNATADICLICDDDEVFLEDTKDKIIKKFEENNNVDIIRFKLEGIEEKLKKYPLQSVLINKVNFGQIGSWEIAFRLEKIIENQIFFDENFGAGTNQFNAGEENIFIFDTLKKGLIIKYFPIYIANIHINNNSTWFKGYNEKFFITKGAFFERVFPSMSWLYSIMFLLKPHKNNLFNKISIFKAYKYMLLGIKQYRKIK